jgi:hypothetical protein
MKGKLNIPFDWKTMGINAYVPILLVFVLLLYGNSVNYNIKHLIPALEVSLTPFAAWWTIFLFQDILEEPGGETIFSFPIQRWKLGIGRIFIFFVIYTLFMLGLLLLIELISSAHIATPLFVQFFVESLFFVGLGFLSMVVLKNCSWSLVVLTCYVSTQILTHGTLLPYTNIFLFNQKLIPIIELLQIQIPTIIMAIFFLFIAQKLFNKN